MSKRLHVKYNLFFSILIKLHFSWLIFEESSNIKFYQNSSSVVEVFHEDKHDRHTDGHNEAYSFRNFANAPKNLSTCSKVKRVSRQRLFSRNEGKRAKDKFALTVK
jgi:hypothetical protein